MVFVYVFKNDENHILINCIVEDWKSCIILYMYLYTSYRWKICLAYSLWIINKRISFEEIAQLLLDRRESLPPLRREIFRHNL